MKLKSFFSVSFTTITLGSILLFSGCSDDKSRSITSPQDRPLMKTNGATETTGAREAGETTATPGLFNGTFSFMRHRTNYCGVVEVDEETITITQDGTRISATVRTTMKPEEPYCIENGERLHLGGYDRLYNLQGTVSETGNEAHFPETFAEGGEYSCSEDPPTDETIFGVQKVGDEYFQNGENITEYFATHNCTYSAPHGPEGPGLGIYICELTPEEIEEAKCGYSYGHLFREDTATLSDDGSILTIWRDKYYRQ